MNVLARLVAVPLPAPWWPQPPPLDLAGPIVLPDLPTLARVLEGLRRL